MADRDNTVCTDITGNRGTGVRCRTGAPAAAITPRELPGIILVTLNGGV
jgi:hypothetical protein